jgi:hypothetical protein
LRSVAARNMTVATRDYPLASLTELHVTDWSVDGFGLAPLALPRLRHLVLSRYSPPSLASPPSRWVPTVLSLSWWWAPPPPPPPPIAVSPKDAAHSWRTEWRAFVDPIAVVAPNLQTLEAHCLSSSPTALGKPHVSGVSRCIHFPTLLAHLRPPPDEAAMRVDSWGEDVNAFAPCVTLMAERTLTVFVAPPCCPACQQPLPFCDCYAQLQQT